MQLKPRTISIYLKARTLGVLFNLGRRSSNEDLNVSTPHRYPAIEQKLLSCSSFQHLVTTFVNLFTIMRSVCPPSFIPRPTLRWNHLNCWKWCDGMLRASFRCNDRCRSRSNNDLLRRAYRSSRSD